MSVYLGTTLLAGTATETKYNANNLLDFKWTDHELNDQSWLNANTFSWQDGTVCSDAYNHLLTDYSGGTSQTETIGSYTITFVEASDGHRITTDETTVANIYAESGVAWFYVLDSVNTRFKLPRIDPSRQELLQTIGCRGTGIGLGFTDGTNNGSTYSSSTSDISTTRTHYGSNVGTTASNETKLAASKVIGIVSDTEKSGIVADLSSVSSVFSGNLYLYFYVGQFSQSATEQTAGLNASLFNGKMDRDMSNMNASQTAKETITGWGCPDYTRQVSVSLPYTATSDGIFFFKGNNSANVTNKFKINDLEFWFNGYGTASGGNIPMKKGQQISWVSGGLGSPTYTFVPYSGE